MSIVPHLDHPVNTLSGATLVAEMQRVGQHYQAAVLADDMERAEMCQRHYYALEQLRKVEIRELARQRRQQEIEQALAELEKSGVEIERRISAMEAQHGL